MKPELKWVHGRIVDAILERNIRLFKLGRAQQFSPGTRHQPTTLWSAGASAAQPRFGFEAGSRGPSSLASPAVLPERHSPHAVERWKCVNAAGDDIEPTVAIQVAQGR